VENPDENRQSWGTDVRTKARKPLPPPTIDVIVRGEYDIISVKGVAMPLRDP